MNDLIKLVSKYKYPVGVEWQGLFEDDEDEDDEDEEEEEEETDDHEVNHEVVHEQDDSETEDDDYGHYSIVTYANRRRKELIIADPYKDFRDQDRIFSFSEFEERWYDFNEVPDPATGHPKLVEDYHMLFIIAPETETFPVELGMHPVR